VPASGSATYKEILKAFAPWLRENRKLAGRTQDDMGETLQVDVWEHQRV